MASTKLVFSKPFRDGQSKEVITLVHKIQRTMNEWVRFTNFKGVSKYIKYYGQGTGMYTVTDSPDEEPNDQPDVFGFAGTPLFVDRMGALGFAAQQLGGFEQVEWVCTETSAEFKPFG